LRKQTFRAMFATFVLLMSALFSVAAVPSDSVLFEHYSLQARTYYFSHPDSTRIYADSLLQLGERSDNKRYMAQGNRWKAVHYHVAANYDDALIYYKEATRLFESISDSVGWTEGLLSIAIMSINKSNFDEALSMTMKALEIAEMIQNERLVGRTLSETAKVFSLRGDHQRALPYFERYLELSLKRESEVDIADAYSHLATVNNYLENYERAISYGIDAASRYEKLGSINSRASVFQVIGNAYKELGEMRQANRYYFDSMELYKAQNNVRGLGIANFNLGVNYLGLNNFALAEEYLIEAQRFNKMYNHSQLVAQTYEKLSEVYAKSGDFNEALNMFRQFHTTNDSIRSVDRERTIAELEQRFETREKEQLISMQQLELSKQDVTIQRNRVLLSGMGISLLLLVLGVLFWRSKVRQRELEFRVGQLEVAQKIQKERERISRDLHDHVGAQLVNMLSGIDLAERYTGSGNSGESSKIMHSLKDEAQTTIKQLRDTIWTLNSSEITTLAFLEKLDAYIKQVESVTQLQILKDFADTLEVRLSPTQALNIFRIIQESLQNTIKHANASKVMIRFEQINGGTHLSIKDDGKFVENATPLDGGGSGLNNMRKRAEEIGAKFGIRHDDQGTEILVEMSKV